MKRLWHLEPDLPIGAFRPVGKKMTLHGGGGGGFLKAIVPLVATYFLGPAGLGLSTAAAGATGGALGGALSGGGLGSIAKGGLLGGVGGAITGGLGGAGGDAVSNAISDGPMMSNALGGSSVGSAPGALGGGLDVDGSDWANGATNGGLPRNEALSNISIRDGVNPNAGSLGTASDMPTPGAGGNAPGALGGVGDTISNAFGSVKDAYNSASPFTKDLIGGGAKILAAGALSNNGSSKAFDPASLQAPTTAPIAASPNSLGFGGLGVADSSKEQTPNPTVPDPTTPSMKSYAPYDPRQRQDTAGSGSYSGALAGGYS